MAIDYSQIDELLQHHSSQHPVISLYLNVTPPRDFPEPGGLFYGECP